jgi:hypothetical protein
MNSVQRIWQITSPNFLLTFVRFLMEPESLKKQRKAVLEHFSKLDKKSLPPEIREGLAFLKYHKYTPFPYKWTQKYDNLLPEVFFDEANQAFYAMFEGKKMYFPKRYSRTKVIWAMRSILKEQDAVSPHLYLTSNFQVEPGSIIIDAGVAEGNFALSVVEKAKQLILIECENEWMEALKLTFEPWKEKVVFVEKYMSDKPGDTTVSIDSLVNPERGNNYFIKMDIEGYEKLALSGMTKLLASGNPIKMNVCTYHHPNDFIDIKAILESFGFSCQVSEGYVLFFQPGEEPSFRKVLIRAGKKLS